MLRVFAAALLAFAATAVASNAALAPIHAEGSQLVAGGHPIRLRGIDWGWWNNDGTRYTEDDMRQQAAWGANAARLAFSYKVLETRNQPGAWNEDGFRQMDDVVKWGARYGVYIILDMHETPGGQNGALYDDGGGDRLWTDSDCQRRYIALWQEIARRYRNNPAVAAYELLNEPDTLQPTSAILTDTCLKAIDAIRAIDPDKTIVLCGDHKSGPFTVNDSIYVPRPNILYTLHFYDGGGDRWLRNLTNGPGISGTQDWTLLKQTFNAPADASALHIMLRSANNTGTAWFDDVQLTDSTGQVLASDNFDHGQGAYQPERGPRTPMSYDPGVGHNGLGSLRVAGTTIYNGWAGPKVAIQPGATYTLTAWVKLNEATGDTYLSAAFIADSVLPKDQLRPKLQQCVDFSRKHNVPMWIGEFGCEASTPQHGQTAWVRDCVSLFEEVGFDWTYWNYRETTNPLSMALHPEHKDGSDYPVNSDLLAVLQDGWSLNRTNVVTTALP